MTEPAPADDPRPAGRLAWIALAPLALVVAFALAGPITSGDLWWHVNAGEWMLSNGELPEHDPFSHTAGDKAWTLEEYGAQILFALLHRAAGITGLRVVGALVGVLVLVAFYRTLRRDLSPAWSTALTATFALLFALKWELRPHLLSAFFLFRLQAVLFPRARDRDPGPREWAEVFVLTLVWVQLHAEAIFVPILAVAGLIGAALAAFVNGEGGIARVRAWLVTTLVGLGASLLSPEGWNQLLYAVSESSIPRDFIEEWFPAWVLPGDVRFAPLTPGVFGAMALATVTGGLYVLVAAVTRLRRGEGVPSWERIGFLAVCVLMAVLARRFFWLLAFPLVDLVAGLATLRPRVKSAVALPVGLALAATALLASTHYPRLAWKSYQEGELAADVDDELFPVHAARFLAEAGVEGNLFHRYEWGGFLGFHLWPACRVYLDGRTVLFSHVIPERWELERWAIWNGFDRGPEATAFPREILNDRDVRAIVMPSLVDYGAGVAPWKPPRAHEEWIRAWADATAIVWVRWDDSENVGRVQSWYETQGVDFDPERGFVEAAAVWSRPEWIRERDLLSPPVRELVEPMLFGDGTGAVPRWSRPARIETWLRVGMGRSARWELEQWIAELTEGDDDSRRAWLDSLNTDPVPVVYGRLARGERP